MTLLRVFQQPASTTVLYIKRYVGSKDTGVDREPDELRPDGAAWRWNAGYAFPFSPAAPRGFAPLGSLGKRS